MGWTAYSLSVPIDFGWDFLPSLERAGEMIAARYARDLLSFGGDGSDPVATFKANWDRAKKLALAEGWEGDGGEPHQARTFWIPGMNTFVYAFAFKQGNDGTTFVISPVALPWLVT